MTIAFPTCEPYGDEQTVRPDRTRFDCYPRTSGIGRALALGLAEHGSEVVASGRTQQTVAAVTEEIESHGRRTIPHNVAATRRESLDALRDAVLAQFGPTDILVNAAGVTKREPTADVSDSDWSRLVDTNLNSVVRACQCMYSPLRRADAVV